jgi:DsbC/DsbD-like thiol-disulfide interchange protein
MRQFFVGLALVLFTGFSSGVLAENRVKATLISDVETAVAGSTIRVGVLFEIPAGGHIYWHNPGDSGLATGIEWTMEDSLSVGNLEWPAPRQFSIEGLANEAYFGYTGQVLLFSDITLSKDAALKSTIEIHAKAYWLLCLDDGVCIPEDLELKISIPIVEESRKAYEATLFDQFAEQVPEPGGPNEIIWTVEPTLSVAFVKSEGLQSTGLPWEPRPRFVPNEGGAWKNTSSHRGKIVFEPEYEGDKATGGVLILPLRDRNSGKEYERYIEVEAPDTPLRTP